MTLTPLASDALDGIAHGFFTRQGGVSTGDYAGLNCGPGSGDAPDQVAENRARVSEAMGVDANRLFTLHQVHSDAVVNVDATTSWAERPRADGLVTATPGMLLGALHADCAPILFADPDAGVVGAAHAGWRGALGGMPEAMVAAMTRLGARASAITAVVGPTISQRSYEVGAEFFDAFEAEDPDYSRFFASGAGDRLQFDLPGFILSRLRATGVGHCEWTGHCTYLDPERFFSYRRGTHNAAADYGRLISVIRL